MIRCMLYTFAHTWTLSASIPTSEIGCLILMCHFFLTCLLCLAGTHQRRDLRSGLQSMMQHPKPTMVQGVSVSIITSSSCNVSYLSCNCCKVQILQDSAILASLTSLEGHLIVRGNRLSHVLAKALLQKLVRSAFQVGFLVKRSL